MQTVTNSLPYVKPLHHDPEDLRASWNQYEITQPPSIDATEIQLLSWPHRLRRWALQAASSEILKSQYRIDKNEKKQQKFRVSFCQRRKRKDQEVDLVKKNGLHHYAGLMQCGSVWTCPICASKISERRRVEIQEAVETWTNYHPIKEGGTIPQVAQLHRATEDSETSSAYPGSVVMLTQTVPHYKTDSLQSILNSFKKARRKQRNRKNWKNWASRYLTGIITAQEVTHGVNGWHVHTHEILFLNSTFTEGKENHRLNNKNLYISFDALKKDAIQKQTKLPKQPFLEVHQKHLYTMWASAAVDSGFQEPSKAHGLDLSDSDEVAGYAAKWGIDLEITKTHLKNGRKHGRTPWAILSDFLDHGDCDDADLFLDFATHFHGKRQLVWSRGLKTLLNIKEKSDDELLDESENGEIALTFTVKQWRLILAHNVRGQLVEVANAMGIDGVNAYLVELLNKPLKKHFRKRGIT